MKWRFPKSVYTGHDGRQLPRYDSQYLLYYVDVLTRAGEEVVRDLEVDWSKREGGGFPIEVSGMPGFIDFSDWPQMVADRDPSELNREVRELPFYLKASMLKRYKKLGNVYPVGPTIGGRPGGAFGAGPDHERNLYWDNREALKWTGELPEDPLLYGYLAGVRNGHAGSTSIDSVRRGQFVEKINAAGIPYEDTWVEPLPFWKECVKATAILDGVGSRPATIGRKLVEGLGLGCVVLSNSGIRDAYGPGFCEFDNTTVFFIDNDDDIADRWEFLVKNKETQKRIRENAIKLYENHFAPEVLGQTMVKYAERALRR